MLIDIGTIGSGLVVGAVSSTIPILQYFSSRSFNTTKAQNLVYPIVLRVNNIIISILVAGCLISGGFSILGIYVIYNEQVRLCDVVFCLVPLTLTSICVYMLIVYVKFKALELTEKQIIYRSSARNIIIIERDEICGYHKDSNSNICFVLKHEKKTIKVPLIFKDMDILRLYIKGIPYRTRASRIQN